MIIKLGHMAILQKAEKSGTVLEKKLQVLQEIYEPFLKQFPEP